MSQIKIQRKTGTGVSLSKTQLDIETQFKNIQDTQQNLYNNLKLLINSIFESYKKNNYKNDNRIKLLSSFLLLRNISDKNIGFTKLIVEQKENVQSYINKIVNDILQTKIESNDFDLSDINSQYGSNSIENLTEQQEKDINDDIFNIYQDIVGEFSKEIQNTLKTINEKDDNSEKQKTSFNIYKGKKQKKRKAKKQNKKYNEFLKDHIKIDQKSSEKIALRLFSNFIGIIEKNQNILEKTSNQLQNSGINTIFSNNKNDIKNRQYDKSEKKQINTYKDLIKRLKKSIFIQRKYQNPINVRLRKLRARMWLISKRNTGKISLFSKMLIKPLGIVSKFAGIFGVVGGVLGSIISSSAKIVGKTFGWIGSKVKKLTSFIISTVSNVVKQVAKPLIPLFMGFLMTPQGAYMMGFLYGTIFKKIQKLGSGVWESITAISSVIYNKFLTIQKEIKAWDIKLAHILLNFNFGKIGKLVLMGIKELLYSCTPMGMINSAGQYLTGMAVSNIGMGLIRLAIGKSAGGLIGLCSNPIALAVGAVAATGYGIYNFYNWVQKKGKEKQRKNANIRKYNKEVSIFRRKSNTRKKRNERNRRLKAKFDFLSLESFDTKDKKVDEKQSLINRIRQSILKESSETAQDEKDQMINDFIEEKFNELHQENLKLQDLHITGSTNKDDYYIPSIDFFVNGQTFKNKSLQSIVGNDLDQALALRSINLKFQMDNLVKISEMKISDIDTSSNEDIKFEEKITRLFNNLNKSGEIKIDDKSQLTSDNEMFQSEIKDYKSRGNADRKDLRLSYLMEKTSDATSQLSYKIESSHKQVFDREISDFKSDGVNPLKLNKDDKSICIYLLEAIFRMSIEKIREKPLTYSNLIEMIISTDYFKNICIKNNTEYYKMDWKTSNFKNDTFNFLFSHLFNDQQFREKFNSYVSVKSMWQYIKPILNNNKNSRKVGDVVLSYFKDMNISGDTLMTTKRRYILGDEFDKSDYLYGDNIFPTFGKIKNLHGIKMSNGEYRRFKFHPTHHESDRGRYVYHIEINEQLDEHNRIITVIIENIYNLLLTPFQLYDETIKRKDIGEEYTSDINEKTGTVTGMAIEGLERMGSELQQFVKDGVEGGSFVDVEYERQHNRQMMEELKQKVKGANKSIEDKSKEIERRKKDAQVYDDSIQQEQKDGSKTKTTVTGIGEEKPKFSSSTQRENRARLFKVQQTTRV